MTDQQQEENIDADERTPRYIEESFPIVQLNPLARKERYWYYPVYKMHKWYARRSASTFRAILLGAALPAEDDDGEPIDLMEEYFESHKDDPRLLNDEGEPMTVLDPFMGGGTTVVEAARLGFNVIGSDYNPIPWFIVKTQTTPIDLDELDAAYQRLADKVKEPLLDLYKTECPVTGKDGDIIYGFWVKQGICVDPNCGEVTDLFKKYIVGRIQGDLGLYYFPDVECPNCNKEFDWEIERCTITAGGPQIEGNKPSGKKRPEGTKYAHGLLEDGVDCPHCDYHVQQKDFTEAPNKTKKKVRVEAVVDPTNDEFFEVRGGVPKEITSPVSGHTFEPKSGTTYRGKFTCEHCGRKQAIVDSAEAHGEPLPFRYYGVYAHSPHLDEDAEVQRQAREMGLPTNNDKWFAPVSDEDLAKVEYAQQKFEEVGDELPIPDQEIPEGRNFRDLRCHMYRKWSDLFGERHKLALGMLLKAIAEEPDDDLRDALLGAFQCHLENASNLAAYDMSRNMLQRVTAAHDYRNPTTIAENNIWGMGQGRGPFSNSFDKVRDGYEFAQNSYVKDTESNKIDAGDVEPDDWLVEANHSSANSLKYDDSSVDLVVTDPPYAGSVQYGEMSDYFYVWLHQVLKEDYSAFEPEITLKSQEIIEDEQTKGPEEYFEMLTEAWTECHRVLKDDGILAFSFHHKEGDRWTGLLESLFEAGFYLVGAYPTHSEALESIVIQSTGGITYDIIHVCRKRLGEVEPIAWTELRKQVRRDAREQLARIEESGDVLPGPDVWMILLGKALKLFSQHYGKVIGHDGEPLELEEAMERLRVLVREVRGEELPLPTALRDADGLSQVYFMHVAGAEGWKKDGLHIELRGYAHTPHDLVDRGLIREDPESNNRLEPVPVLERYEQEAGELSDARKSPLVDKLHLLLGAADAGDDIGGLMDGWRGYWELIKEGLSYLGEADEDISDLVGMVLRTIDTLGAEGLAEKGSQQKLVLEES